ncbi:MAG: hypothetical protein BWY04_00257 [candidate division CPR1 bacterium ADurb.Bin160]|jgi:hypothetical protein|uniref:Uncharacterized protein n=1 Tax=candidate division CPR1 bacterium ADurb.Bin160 TaxID=1852826 RepID=A0A1V5ZQM9_9BACT|nr:MAG: hypothetical protein BWY04_00257 [candidate division CPR1 bacterium ADurb.Bin160]
MSNNKTTKKLLIKKIMLIFAMIFLFSSIFVLVVFSENRKLVNYTSNFKNALNLKFTVLNPFPEKERIKSVYLIAG